MNITKLQIQVADLARCAAFYTETLGFRPSQHQPHRLILRAGSSELHLAETASRPTGVYHFAFNIPENQIEAAHTWLLDQVNLLSDDQGQTTFYFQGWNAHAVYFKDPEGNIAEFIARHTLPNASASSFTSDAILCISEIGMATENVPAMVARYKRDYGLSIYQSSGDEFSPVGDEHGLFIIVKQGRRWYPEVKDPAALLPVEVEFRAGSQVSPYRLAVAYSAR